jgi:hypothetical protein
MSSKAKNTNNIIETNKRTKGLPPPTTEVGEVALTLYDYIYYETS